MSELILHCGGEPIDLNGLREIPMPMETPSYKPVSHFDMAMNLKEVADQLLPFYCGWFG